MDANRIRIYKNTMFLYMRTLLVMFVTLYTTRIILSALGVEDYGIFNVVGGVVTLLAVFNNSMSAASSRYISYAIGKKDDNLISSSYSTIKRIHLILAIIVFILSETIGLWFVCEKMNIPDNRYTAAILCYQSSVIISVITILCIPYNALIMAYEKMNAYAYISIVDALLRLIIVYCLYLFCFDHLILYSLFLLLAKFIISAYYYLYCKKHFEVIKAKVQIDQSLVKKITSFACWNFNGQLALLGNTQGINILLNLFFGPIVNAARGICVQIQVGANLLSSNFQAAIRPQIIKNWATQDLKELHNLVIMATKFGFLLTCITVFPLIWNIEFILSIWLGSVPEHTVEFAKIILYSALVESFSNGMIMAIHATGDIRRFQIIEGTILLSIVPIAYFLLKFYNVSPESVLWIYLYVQFLAQIARLTIVLPKIKMSFKEYIKKLLPNVIMILSILMVSTRYMTYNDVILTNNILHLAISIIFVLFCCFLFGLNHREKRNTIKILLTKFR